MCISMHIRRNDLFCGSRLGFVRSRHSSQLRKNNLSRYAIQNWGEDSMQSFASRLMIAVTLLVCSCFAAWAKDGNFDGPAELPRVTVASSMADTPTSGSITQVGPADDLQAAFNDAACGDTIELQAGATFTGIFTLPAKNCDNNHWIVIRTSSSDSLLPAEGQRVSPCYAGVASLPGRPQFACSNPQKVLATIVNNTGNPGPIILRKGANHYRFVGLELTRTVGVWGSPVLISVEVHEAANHIIVDRSWLHGTERDETQ